MKRLAGQAGRTLFGLFQWAGMAAITLFLIALLTAGALAYRLSHGPLPLPWAARLAARELSGPQLKVQIGNATLSWMGWHNGSYAPLLLQLDRIALTQADGSPLASIAQARMMFSLSSLFARQLPIYLRAFGRLQDVAAPLSLNARISLSGLALADAKLRLALGPGQLGPPGYALPAAAATIPVEITPRDMRIADAVVTLAPYGQSAPVLHVDLAAHKSQGWQGSLRLRLAAVQAADLGQYWPARMIPLTRAWVTRNITGGTARNADFTLAFAAAPDLSGLTVTDERGGFDAEDLTLSWLQGVQPLTGLTGIFTLTDHDNIDIQASRGSWGGVRLENARMHIFGVSKTDQTGRLEIPVSGTLEDTLAMLNGPNLALLQTVPAQLRAATGRMNGMVRVTLPLQGEVTAANIQLDVATKLTQVTLPLPISGLAVTDASFAVQSSMQALKLSGGGSLGGRPAAITANAVFGAGPQDTGRVRVSLQTVASAALLKAQGWDLGGLVQGDVPVRVQLDRNGEQGEVMLDADLAAAGLSLPFFGWRKPAGAPGHLGFAARFDPQTAVVQQIERIEASAPGLSLDSAAEGPEMVLSRVQIGATEGSGSILPPAAAGQPWRLTLQGNSLDLSSLIKPQVTPASAVPARPAAPQPPAQQPPAQSAKPFPWIASARFGTLLLAPAPAPPVQNLVFNGSGVGSVLLTAEAVATPSPGRQVSLSIAPRAGVTPGATEALALRSDDGGQLLRTLAIFNDLSGGDLDLTASYGDGQPTAGTARLTRFRLLNAPAMGKLLQAITVLGIPEAASGPGLLFDRLVLPFSIQNQVMRLHNARAYSASLGLTASGTVDLAAGQYDISGTVVPAYALNALPGKVPLLGRLFSPEKGGGLFAVRFSMTGPVAEPKMSVNPLSALTPGFLRGIFGLSAATAPSAPNPPAAPAK